MRRLILAVTTVLTAGLPSLATAQNHTEHRHPPGAKIIISGTVADPICRFALKLSGREAGECAEKRMGTIRSPALLGRDGNLYLLDVPQDRPAGELEALREWLEKQVTIMGTVFPAGSAYLILVDSVSAYVPRSEARPSNKRLQLALKLARSFASAPIPGRIIEAIKDPGLSFCAAAPRVQSGRS